MASPRSLHDEFLNVKTCMADFAKAQSPYAIGALDEVTPHGPVFGLIAGQREAGKTGMLVHCALNFARRKAAGVLFLSPRTPTDRLVLRMASAVLRKSQIALIRELEGIVDFTKLNLPIWVSSNQFNDIHEFSEYFTALADKVNLIVIDDLDSIFKSENSVSILRSIKDLRNFALSKRIPILATQTIPAQSRAKSSPILSDINFEALPPDFFDQVTIVEKISTKEKLFDRIGIHMLKNDIGLSAHYECKWSWDCICPSI